MQTRVKRWGNSLALRIPSSFAADAGLEADSPVELILVEGTLVIRPALRGRLRLEDLLARVTESNLHEEIDTGAADGDEAW